MSVKIVWTKPARQDLREIFTYIAEENPNAARRLLAEIKEKAVLLQSNPQLGRAGRAEGTRELVIAGTHYLLPYRLKGQQLQILAVFHGRREWPDSFQGRRYD